VKKIDYYIIRKFLGTFFFTLALIIVIVIIFDISEKLDDFIKHHAPLYEIVFHYYATFIPYFVNLFSPLFTFIAVVYFTSRMAYNTEIIAILSSGISFKRFMKPYLISSLIIAGLSFYLANFLIPKTNKIKNDFELHYIRSKYFKAKYNIHVQNKPGEILYVESFNVYDKKGYNFTFEKFNDKGLYYKMKADNFQYDTLTGRWKIRNYFIRYITPDGERFEKGEEIDTTFNVKPDDFSGELQPIDVMSFTELRQFIREEKIKGSEKVKFYEVAKHKRVAFPFATIILTFIGVALSSRKLRGGIGLQLALGIIISFSFIVIMQVSTVFATFGTLSPWIAVWIPNIVFAALAIYLLIRAPK
jgi:lipopolysaccharide export system permease protein